MTLVYNGGLEQFAKALTDLNSDDLRVLLVKDTYTPDPDHLVVDDVSADELTVSGYARQALAGKGVTRDDVNDFVYLDAIDLIFTGLAAGETVGGAIVYRNDSDDDAISPLLWFYPLPPTATGTDDLRFRWAAPSAGALARLSSG